MAEVGELLKGIAAVLWPSAMLFVLALFYRQLRELIVSAKTRKFVFKVAGQELSMEEASQQQQHLIADLQKQVVEIKKKTGVSSEPILAANTPPAVRSVLWVDDHPKNNSYLVQQLIDSDVSIDLSLSTAEGLARFARKRYDVVITDMSRDENKRDNPTAGIDLVKAVRSQDKEVPVLVYCSSRGVRNHGREAASAGATAVTSSATELLGHLARLGMPGA